MALFYPLGKAWIFLQGLETLPGVAPKAKLPLQLRLAQNSGNRFLFGWLIINGSHPALISIPILGNWPVLTFQLTPSSEIYLLGSVP
jgi:hypothetical protein